MTVSDYLPYHIWMENFMKYQGYTLKKKYLYQDNQSAIKMEQNGRNSCTGNSRHVDIRFFFVHDRVKTGKLKVQRIRGDSQVEPLKLKIVVK